MLQTRKAIRMHKMKAIQAAGCLSFTSAIPETMLRILSANTIMVKRPKRSTIDAEAVNTWPLCFNTVTIVRAPINDGVRLRIRTIIHKIIAVLKEVKIDTINKIKEAK